MHLLVPHTTLTSHALGMGQGQNVALREFCHILTLLPHFVNSLCVCFTFAGTIYILGNNSYTFMSYVE